LKEATIYKQKNMILGNPLTDKFLPD